MVAKDKNKNGDVSVERLSRMGTYRSEPVIKVASLFFTEIWNLDIKRVNQTLF